jgi:hypothetical protein
MWVARLLSAYPGTGSAEVAATVAGWRAEEDSVQSLIWFHDGVMQRRL